MTAQDRKWFGRVEAQVQASEEQWTVTNFTSVTSCRGPHQTSHVVSVSSIFFGSALRASFGKLRFPEIFAVVSGTVSGQ